MTVSTKASAEEMPACNELASIVSDAIIKATHELGLGLDVAVCVVAAVAADYARGDLGDDYLHNLADVVLDRVNFPPPASTPVGRA